MTREARTCYQLYQDQKIQLELPGCLAERYVQYSRVCFEIWPWRMNGDGRTKALSISLDVKGSQLPHMSQMGTPLAEHRTEKHDLTYVLSHSPRFFSMSHIDIHRMQYIPRVYSDARLDILVCQPLSVEEPLVSPLGPGCAESLASKSRRLLLAVESRPFIRLRTF